MTKPIIVVKICYKLLYVIQVDNRFLISKLLGLNRYQSFWSHIPICNAASDWPRTFFTPGVFLFSISLLFWKYKHMLLLASSIEVLHGHNLYLPSTQYCKLNFEAKLKPKIFLNFHYRVIHQCRLYI